jgi:hypothetical protein
MNVTNPKTGKKDTIKAILKKVPVTENKYLPGKRNPLNNYYNNPRRKYTYLAPLYAHIRRCSLN